MNAEIMLNSFVTNLIQFGELWRTWPSAPVWSPSAVGTSVPPNSRRGRANSASRHPVRMHCRKTMLYTRAQGLGFANCAQSRLATMLQTRIHQISWTSFYWRPLHLGPFQLSHQLYKHGGRTNLWDRLNTHVIQCTVLLFFMRDWYWKCIRV
jgi:hypothetical protein